MQFSILNAKIKPGKNVVHLSISKWKKVRFAKLSHSSFIASPNQSHYREVPRWEIFMEQKLRFGLDLGRLAVLKKKGLGRL